MADDLFGGLFGQSESAEELFEKGKKLYDEEKYANYKVKKQTPFGEVIQIEYGAVHYLYEAAKKGHARAMYCIGVCYLYGEGLEKDEKLAIEWLKKSAELGDAYAESMLIACTAPEKAAKDDDGAEDDDDDDGEIRVITDDGSGRVLTPIRKRYIVISL